MPFLFRMLSTSSYALGSSKGRPDMGAQWSKLFWGKAIPCVFSLRRRESECLGDWDVGLDQVHGAAFDLALFYNFSSPLAEGLVNSSKRLAGRRYLAHEYGF